MLFLFSGGRLVWLWLAGKVNSVLGYKLGRTIRGYKTASIEMEVFSFELSPYTTGGQWLVGKGNSWVTRELVGKNASRLQDGFD